MVAGVIFLLLNLLSLKALAAGPSCVPLKPPPNGAVVCIPWGATGQYCQQRCHRGYNLPYSVQHRAPGYRGVFTCPETQNTWRPTNSVFECVDATLTPNALTLPETFHYDGKCSSTTMQMKIKQTFLSSTSSIKYICPTCTVKDVSVNCGPDSCPSLPTPGASGTIKCINGRSIGSDCVVACNPGYDFGFGSHSVRCGKEGRWLGSLITCEAVACPPPPTISHGKSNCTGPTVGSQMLQGSQCAYTCDAGYIMQAEDRGLSVKCSASKTWIGKTPSCTRPPCTELPAPNNGAIVCGPWGKQGRYCQQHCNKYFDLPSGPSIVPAGYGSFKCSATGASGKGVWHPSDTVVDCVGRPPAAAAGKLPVTSYYDGLCFDAAVQQSIRQRFLDHLIMSNKKTTLCPSCALKTIDVTCGNSTVVHRCKEVDLSPECHKYAKDGLCSTMTVQNYCKKSCLC